VRRSIHVGNLTYNDGNKVEQHLLMDLMQSAKPQLTETMNYYKVLRSILFHQLSLVPFGINYWFLPFKQTMVYEFAS